MGPPALRRGMYTSTLFTQAFSMDLLYTSQNSRPIASEMFRFLPPIILHDVPEKSKVLGDKLCISTKFEESTPWRYCSDISSIEITHHPTSPPRPSSRQHHRHWLALLLLASSTNPLESPL